MYSPNYLQTVASESVSAGHPDKVADQVSDTMTDAALSIRNDAHVACETVVTRGRIIVLGEISGDVIDELDVEQLARQTIANIGYTDADIGMDAWNCQFECHLGAQSEDINGAVSAGSGKGRGAGDQGMMYGYATNETDTLMPTPIALAHALLRRLDTARKQGEIPWARPDAKAQVAVEYENNKPKRIANIVMSVQHHPGVDWKVRHDALLNLIIDDVVPKHLLDSATNYFLAKHSQFVQGGPAADTGLTGRKIIVDTYGGVGRHGGGAFSGKDPSKVDRSAAYMARYLARHVVAADLADRCEIQLAYVLGRSEPVALHVDTFGGAGRAGTTDRDIAICLSSLVDATPDGIIERFDLLRPIYQPTAAYGHFGRPEFPWEKCDKELLLAIQDLAPERMACHL